MSTYHIALAGNPNVGKSTVFNALTGLHQHTGNWAGKTVSGAVGTFSLGEDTFILTDLPGIYSLRSSSAEETAAREHLCTQSPDAVAVVCDACCLERNLGLVLQVRMLSERVIVCVNLLDEAEERDILVNCGKLSELLGVPVVGMAARNGDGLSLFREKLQEMFHVKQACFVTHYPDALEAAVQVLTDDLTDAPFPRWTAERLLEAGICPEETIPNNVKELQADLLAQGWTPKRIRDTITQTFTQKAAEIAAQCVQMSPKSDAKDRKMDRILLSRKFGVPILLFLLAGMLWLTIIGANYPSELLSRLFFSLGEHLKNALVFAPDWLSGLLIDGMYRTLAWVVAVMLPPMAIFFPLFTLLEDAGYLPRAAYLLDRPLRKCGACGKQALTMCMGIGCNACGVTGCRIIESPRERLLAILTNAFMPCNGRFPLLISLTAMFLVTGEGIFSSFAAAIFLLLMLLAGVGMTFLVSGILSKTMLRGFSSAFLLELPPYRRPQFGRVLLRSLLDRTIFVLGRACMAAAPAGALIYLLANVQISGQSLLLHISDFLNPFAECFGMNGMILLAFLLGFPANEIVIPLILMGCLSQGSLTDISEFSTIQSVLVENGWTWLTALCTMCFSLFHFPCATTVLTIRKETNSNKWAFFSMILPTVCGLAVCFLVYSVGKCFL